MHASFLKILAPCIWSFLLCRLFFSFFRDRQDCLPKQISGDPLELDGHIRTAEFTQPTGITVLRTRRYGLLMLIQLKHLLRAKGHADIAALAKIPVDLNRRSML